MQDVTITVVEDDGSKTELVFPTDMALSLMEGLKGSGYPVMATCGGMALCATCRISVIEGGEELNEPGDDELDMLDTLPDSDDDSRLACQIPISDNINGLVLRLDGAVE